MKFTINHIHIKSNDPLRTTKWYVDHLEPSIEHEMNTAIGKTLRRRLRSIIINITQPFNTTLPAETTEPHLGLEHFGIQTHDTESTVSY